MAGYAVQRAGCGFPAYRRLSGAAVYLEAALPHEGVAVALARDVEGGEYLSPGHELDTMTGLQGLLLEAAYRLGSEQE